MSHPNRPPDNIGPNMVPLNIRKVSPGRLDRDSDDGPETFFDANTDPGSWQSSYSAQCAGLAETPRQKSCKKILHVPGSIIPIGLGAMTHAPFNLESNLLLLGTTKSSNHVPGYSGHIAGSITPQTPFTPRTIDRFCRIENYMAAAHPGYTGRRDI